MSAPAKTKRSFDGLLGHPVDQLTKTVYSVTMTPWTVHDMQSRLAELDGSADDSSAEKARTRHRILDAATTHFARHGYRKANISEIARDAGIGKGTLYLYFNAKEALLVAAVAREKLALIPELTAIASLPAPERLEAFIALTLRFALTAPLSGMLLRGDPELLRQLRASTADTQTDDARNLAFATEMLAAAGIAEDQRDMLARILLSVVTLPAHLSDSSARRGVSEDTFITHYARILALGLKAAARQPKDHAP